MPPPPTHRTAAGDAGAARNTAYALAAQVVTGVLTAGLTLYLVRALGPAEFGLFSLALAIATLVLLPADFGISPSVSRFVAERRGDASAVAAVVATGLRLKLLAGLVAAAAMLAAAGPVAEAYGVPGLAGPLRWMALATFAQTLFAFYRYVLIAVRRVRVTLGLVLSESVAEVGASIALVMAGFGAAGAAGGRAAGYAFGALLAAAYVVRLLGRRTHGLRIDPASRTPGILRYAGALLIVDAAYSALSQIETLLVGAILGSAAVGIFTAPLRFIVLLQYVGLAASNGVSPRLAGPEPDVQAFMVATRYVALFQALALAPMVVWATPIVDLLLGPEYEESAAVLRALAPFVFLAGLAPIVTVGVNFLGGAARRVPIALGTLAVAGGLGYVLISEVGVVGAALSASAAFLLYVPAHLVLVRSMLGISLRPLMVTLARGAVAAAAMAGVLALFGTAELSLADWVLGSAAGLLAFVLVLRASGELSASEIRAARTLLRRSRRAGPSPDGSR
jgi:O-antigen/teichoic acid export membrane protein